MSPRLVTVFRIVAVAWLVTVYVKVDLFLTILADARALPVLAHPLFPALFRSSWLVTVAYWLPLPVAAMLAIEKRWALTTVASVFLGCAFVLGWSLDTHNDATFITGLWTALWMLWFSTRLDADEADEGRTATQAIGLAQGVVALVFLGGVVGKLTGDYASGEALLHIYMERKENVPWTWLREVLDEEGRRTVMVWFSRVTIVMEAAVALLPLYPVRAGAAFAIAAMVGIVVVSHITLTSVMACLVGLMIAVWRLDRLRD